MSIERTIQPNDYEYFLMQKINRYNFICNLLSQYHTNEIKNMNFISIGCGLGGEESWVTEKFKKVILLDANPKTISHAKKYYKQADIKGNYKFISSDIKEVIDSFDEKMDVIFTSSPTDWMNSKHDWNVPQHYLDFVKNNLSDDGLFLVRFYGGTGSRGLHHDTLKDGFVSSLISDFEKIGFKVQGIYHISNRKWNTINKKDNFPNEHGRGRGTQCFAIITKKDFNCKSVSFFNYDKDNIYPIQFSSQKRKLNKDNYIKNCHDCIEKLKTFNFKKKLKNNDFIGRNNNDNNK